MQTHSKYKFINWLRRRNQQRKRTLLLTGLILTLLFLAKMSVAQERPQDRSLSAEQIMTIVKKFHPIARIAGINIEKAKADITIARGQFDPQLYSSNAQKTFDGTDYYNYNRPELNIPTWFGVNITTGLEYLSGSRTDPEQTTGKTSYFGISVPLAKNLLMDKRRAALQTAKIYRDASLVEQRAVLNDLLLEAMLVYWDWVNQYQQYQILSQAVSVNEQRLGLVRLAYRQGDRPAIDTTEAMTQLQQFQLMQTQAWLEFRNEGILLSAYLWNDKGEPVDLPEGILPADSPLQQDPGSMTLPELNQLIETARKNHPEILGYGFKLDALEIEKKLKFQELLPTVNFRYNQLGKGYDVLKTATGPLFENNYQYGLTLGLPLRLSQGRGEYRKAKLKLEETRIEQSRKTVLVETKIRNLFNELGTLRDQSRIQSNALENFLTLQRAEETRFRIGESSLFLVNARENKALEARQKLVDLKVKFMKSMVYLNWSTGQLAEL